MSEKRSSFLRPLHGRARPPATGSAWLGASLALLAATGCGEGGSTDAARPLDYAPNVLLLSVDTLRADHLGAYGYSPPTSPNLDRLAAEGALFESAFAQRSQTWPSMTSVLTSLQPREHGVRENGAKLGPGIATLPEMLKARGYQTAAFLTNMKHAPNRGFDEKAFAKREDRDAHVNQMALDWLRNRAREPFFGWVHYIAPHRPYAPPEVFAERFVTEYSGAVDGSYESLAAVTREQRSLDDADLAHLNGLYDAEIAYVDSLIGELLEGLSERGLDERTLVVVVGDHGEELYDHNFYFFHSCSIYDSTLRIPLVMRWPGRLRAETRVDGVVQSIDLAPTVLELLGLPRPSSLSGRSLVAVLRGGPVEPDPLAAAFAEIGAEVRSIRTARWRYVENPNAHRPDCRPYRDAWAEGRRDLFYPIARRALYDLDADPGEGENVLDRYPKVAARLAARLHAAFAGAPADASVVELDPDVETELRELGYIQ
ncbi:MAG: sulfatase [Myxococcales bacterium]|nr:sulfatase [Myxococcales bacterium]